MKHYHGASVTVHISSHLCENINLLICLLTYLLTIYDDDRSGLVTHSVLISYTTFSGGGGSLNPLVYLF